jgi:ubiquinone/menaquinone biosynthesis C-methylase UbiE
MSDKMTNKSYADDDKDNLTDEDIFNIYKGERGVGVNKSLFTEHNFMETPENMRTLEIGFGQGELIRYLLEHKNRVYGIDVGLASIEGAIQDGFIDKACLLYMDASTERLPFIDNFFDIVFMLETIEHLSSPIHAVFEIKRVLKDKGKLVISFPPYEVSGYEGGRHAHVYPGLLAKEPFERFMMQLYFKQIKRMMIGDGTVIYLFENVKNVISEAASKRKEKEGQINIFKVVAGNYTEEELYGHLK